MGGYSVPVELLWDLGATATHPPDLRHCAWQIPRTFEVRAHVTKRYYDIIIFYVVCLTTNKQSPNAN